MTETILTDRPAHAATTKVASGPRHRGTHPPEPIT